ncbi:solute carrier family 23 member 1-like [Anneissia japonica]|uniref:solute carrier family 23 member 1-like n=1 Tax=Anneissia japonica TaxID=1529436 RepID=UPI00142590F8|nr:solute carrier family 23 member 1-like [Anneissia japonica]
METGVQMEIVDSENEEDEIVKKELNSNDILYGLDDTPSWPTTLVLAFQHFLMLFTGCMAIPFIFAPALCIEDNLLVQCYLISTVLFVSGIATLIQTTFGVRLPIAQGGSFTFIIPALAICKLHGDCPVYKNETDLVSNTPEWKTRLLEIQGAILAASFIQMFLGFFGLIGLLQRFITPIVITPTIALIGLSLFESASETAGLHWGVSAATMVSIVVFSQYLRHLEVPFHCKQGSNTRFPLFKLFPVLFGIIFGWIVSFILTVAGGLPDDPERYGYAARTDVRLNVLSESPWFRIPYPCQWGIPKVTIAGFIGMTIAVFNSIIESVGDYYACARLSGAPPVPSHAMNRGISMEGLGCFIDGLIGSGCGTTSYSQNIGAIGITKVASRSVTQLAAAVMMILAIFGKFGAIFVCIPSPVIGAAICILFSMIVGAGLSNLQFIDTDSSRNNFIIGVSIFMGLALPNWLSKNYDLIDTGVVELDQAFKILLSTNMFVGGVIALILDNTVPGTFTERGVDTWQRGQTIDTDTTVSLYDCYDLPLGMSYIRRSTLWRYLPFSPTFKGYKSA